MADQQLAVLVDFENVGLGSIQWLFDQISDIGRIIVKRAYADWSTASSKRDQLLELGIEPIHLFQSLKSGKNSSDIRLTIDAVDILHQSPVDTFVLVSSDSDFVPLVMKLRAAGKMVIGAGRKATTSHTLVISCDRYLFLDQSEKAPQEAGPQPKSRGEDLLVRAVKAAMDAEGSVTGSKLNETLQRLDPSFDFRAQGYSTLTRYLEASPEVKVTRPKGQGDVVVELADVSDSSIWGPRIDAAWSGRAPRSGATISWSAAAADAAKILGFPRLSVSRFKTLQKLLDASDLLASRWSQARNRVIRR